MTREDLSLPFCIGERVWLDAEGLALFGMAKRWPCTIVQLSPTHALLAPDRPMRGSCGCMIQPWVSFDLIEAMG